MSLVIPAARPRAVSIARFTGHCMAMAARRWAMRQRLWLVVLALCPALLSAQDTGAVPDSPRGVVSGRVIDRTSESPILGATVQVRGTARVAPTDSAGRFTLRDLAPGIVALEVRAPGFAPVIVSDIAVSTAKPAEVVVRMQAVDVRLQTVTTRPRAFDVQLPALLPTIGLNWEF